MFEIETLVERLKFVGLQKIETEQTIVSETILNFLQSTPLVLGFRRFSHTTAGEFMRRNHLL